jgi:DNA-directed RNA polymerase subunit RPC12/RpoP|tara:strand:+ start:129 stop:482 length:354 start_codon:yes stop_codon:yes gene_type:complete
MSVRADISEKCIRCGETIIEPEIYKDRKNIYYGEYLCFDCNMMITAEWGMDKELQEDMMKNVKEDGISVMEYVARAVTYRANLFKTMMEITGDAEEAIDLLDNNTEAIKRENGDEEE